MNSLLENVIKNSAITKAGNDYSDSSISYEVAMPIAFIILFLILLFMTYFIKEIVIQKRKFCFSNRSQQQVSRNLMQSGGHVDYSQVRIPIPNYANLNKLNESCQYYEEPRAGFYHVQKLNRNYNYEKIYSDKFKRMPSNLMIPVQSGLKLSKIDETHSYGLPSVKNLEALKPIENRFERNLTRYKSKSINLNASQSNFKQSKLKAENNRIRRSYSNSKLDIKKWQSIMAKQKPNFNKSKKWPSKIMSEHELKIFLSQNKKLRLQGLKNETNDLYRVKNFHNDSRNSQFSNSNPVETKIIKPFYESCNNMTTNKLIKTSSGIHFNEINNKANVKKNNRLSLVKTLSNNLSESKVNHSLKESTLVKLGQKLREKTSEKNILLFKNIKLNKEDKTNELNNFSINNKQTKNIKYSRLCKSFTFLSHKVTENITKKKLIDSIKNNEKFNAFSSDPSKLGSFASFKTNQNNYLKNLSAFKSKGFMSMSSIFEKVSSVSNWNKYKTEKVNDSIIVSSDANQQANSIMFSNSSSLNSQLTTLMQTNNFGSIMANFGSASIKCTQTSKRIYRHRTLSDGNVLSESDSSRINVSECKSTNRTNILTNQTNMSAHSVSFSKLVYLKNRI